MARVFYSSCGEGRGHATRVKALVERLRFENQVVLFAFGEAFVMLSRAYRGSDVRVEEIPGIRFGYGRGERVSFTRTALSVAGYLASLESLTARLAHRIVSERPSLVVTDFEPALPRAARRCNVPIVSLDHQHFLTTEDLRTLPPRLRMQAALIGVVVAAYVRGQSETIVSSFHHLPLRSGVRHVTQVGTLLRPEIRSAKVTDRGHLVAYFRRAVPTRVLEAILASGVQTNVYGLGHRQDLGCLRFLEVDESAFAADLGACRALVTTAGNQIVGEATFLSKPVLALPESANFEQRINAHLLSRSGCGTWIGPEDIQPEHIEVFLRRLDWYGANVRKQRVDGTDAAAAALERYIPGVIRRQADVRQRARPLGRVLSPAVIGPSWGEWR